MKNLIIASLASLNLLVWCSHAEAQPTSNAPAKTGVATKATVHKISAEEAHRMMSKLKNYILLDVRTEKEYREKRIDGAYLIPNYEISDRAAKELPDKETVILIYCRSGRRSANSARELVNMGYRNVYDFGGIISWPFATVKG